jgi:hypothetical protein
MLWDAELWRDSLALVASQVGATGVFTFPDGIERIVAIRSTGNHILDPVDSPYIMQISPGMFEQTGDPLGFEEYTDKTDGKRKARVFPTPTSATALLIVGKRTLVPLNGSDTPVLRGIDNALIAFVQSDMLEKQRQYGKAQAKVQEGAAMLDQMRKLENEQSARQSRVVPFTEPDANEYDSDWFLRATPAGSPAPPPLPEGTIQVLGALYNDEIDSLSGSSTSLDHLDTQGIATGSKIEIVIGAPPSEQSFKLYTGNANPAYPNDEVVAYNSDDTASVRHWVKVGGY